VAAQVADIFRHSVRLRQNWQDMFPRCEHPSCSAAQNLWHRLWHTQRGIRMQNTWYCTPECFENGAAQHFAEMLAQPGEQAPVKHRIPLGLLMISRGQLTSPQLRHALQVQRSAGHGKLGHWLKELGFSGEQQITAGLALQWACPVFALSSSIVPVCVSMLPLPLLESFRMLPVHYVAATRSLYIGFAEKIDYVVLNAIEQMLDCRTHACMVAPGALEDILEQLRQRARPGEICFAAPTDPEEMARITRGYVTRLGAEGVRARACGNYIWLRVRGRRSATSLLFRRTGIA
jgi:hypothetical protein